MTQEQTTPLLDILIVDDNEDDVLLLQESMRDEPSVNLVHSVHDGVEAMAYLRQEGPYSGAPRPGLVLLDINMPKKNGFEVLSEMKGDPQLRTIPVVMLTTSNRDADVMAAYGSGACSFVTKPVSFDRLKVMAGHFVSYWTNVVRVPRVER
ncbi:MAG TPA: response regulator [Planctomycetaceae bacterium]|nr:response regulator [Planctomycetaceae bacterium]